MAEKVTLHRCPFTFIHNNLDSCWKVQKALDEQGVEYDVVKHAQFPRGRRKDLIALSGQQMLPVIQFPDGTAYRDESEAMAATITGGKLFEHTGDSGAT